MQSLLDLASRKYYEGNPILSDVEFDFLADRYNYSSVGYTVTDAYPHAYRMYSLQKWKCEDVASDMSGWICTPKFDGAAVSLLYVGGELHIALTRGDGIQGKDITKNIKCLVPATINLPGIVQLTGEVVAPKSIKNARNYAAGALGLKDPTEFRDRDLTFVAYDLLSNTSPYSNWSTAMKFLSEQGIETAYTLNNPERFPQDGDVWRLDNYKQYNEMGYTSHHPKGAFAVKEEQKPVVTTLREVTWQLGKSGVVSPVGHFDPIEIGGATIRKATLHNIEYIRSLGLQIDCKIGVIRSGEIIPRIVGRYDN